MIYIRFAAVDEGSGDFRKDVFAFVPKQKILFMGFREFLIMTRKI